MAPSCYVEISSFKEAATYDIPSQPRYSQTKKERPGLLPTLRVVCTLTQFRGDKQADPQMMHRASDIAESALL